MVISSTLKVIEGHGKRQPVGSLHLGHFARPHQPLPTSFRRPFPVWGLAINAVHTFNP